MQIVSTGDNLHEMSTLVFLGKFKKIYHVSSAFLIQRVVKINFVEKPNHQTMSVQ